MMTVPSNRELIGTAAGTPLSNPRASFTADTSADSGARENFRRIHPFDAIGVLVLVVLFVAMSSILSFHNYESRERYLPDGGVVTNRVIDYLDWAGGTVTTCIDNPEVPAPEGHPCQKYGH